MTEQKSTSHGETVGLGVQLPTPIKAAPARVWAAMVDKMYNTEKYLPVTNVKTTDVIPGRHAVRDMLLGGQLLSENIYFDEVNYEIRSAVIGKDEIHVNKYDPETGVLEYWQENAKGDRILWPVPKAIVLKAMEMTKEVAERHQ